MDRDQIVDELKINQRFILAGDVYIVQNVDFEIDYNMYKITARNNDYENPLELRVPANTPFATLH